MVDESPELLEQWEKDVLERLADEARFRNVIVDSADAIIVVNRDGYVRYTNPAAEQLFGRYADEFIGEHFGFPLVVGEMTEVDVLSSPTNALTAEMRVVTTEWERQAAYLITFRDITRHKQQELELLNALEQVRNIRLALDKSTIVAVTDRRGRIEYVNDRFCEISKYTREELIGQDHRIVNSGYHPKEFFRNMWRTIARGQIWRGEICNVAKDGTIYWVDTTIVPFLDANGKPRQYIAIRHDITERKLAEEQLQRLNDELGRRNQALLTLHEVSRTLAATLDIREICRVMYREVGQRLLEAPYFALRLVEAGQVIYSFTVIGGQEQEQAFSSQAVPNDELLYQVIRTGEPRMINWGAHPSEDNQPGKAPCSSALYMPLISGEHVIGVLSVQHDRPDAFRETDLTLLSILVSQAAVAIVNARLYEQTRTHAGRLEQRVAERTLELEQERAQLRTILDAMIEGVAYIDQNSSQTRYVNRALLRLTGYEADEVIDQPLSIYQAMLQAPEDYAKIVEALCHNDDRADIWQGEVKMKRRGDGVFDTGVTVTPVPGAQGQPIGKVLLIRDIGQEKALQAQKDQFIANASHELRTPVTNLKMRLYLARQQPERLNEHLEALESATRHLTRLIDNLLDMSRFERGMIALKRRNIILQDLISAVISAEQPEADRQHIGLELELPIVPLHANVDPDRIEQVLLNLVSNAINYTEPGGQVRVKLHAQQCTPTRCALIRVEDTGIGITPEALARIFEPFYRVGEGAARGTGLGLTIAREIIELHGGDITVESQHGVGSAFNVWLPLDQFA